MVNKELLDSLIDIEDLYQNAPCGYLSFLPDGTIIKINKTLLGWLGYTSEELVYKKNFYHIIGKGSAIYYQMVHMPLLKMHGHANEISYDIIRKDNTAFPALINSVLIKDADGKERAVNATLFDITDRKKYEKELLRASKLAESEKVRFEFLANFIPEIIWTATATGDIDYVNKRFYTYFNEDVNPLPPGYIVSKIHPDDRYRCIRAWAVSRKSGMDLKVEARLVNESGSQWHLLRAIAYRDADGQITKWFGSCTNIDEHVHALQLKDEFINIASHELKTPVTSLKAYNQLLQRTDISGKVKSFVEKSAATLNNLQFLIASLLDVSQVNSGQLSLTLEPVSLINILRHSVGLVKLNYPSHNIIEDYNEDEEIFVMADQQRLIQVMINLLSNAIKYSPQADKIILRLIKNSSRGLIRVEVVDFGLGIPPEKVGFIFEKYYRVSETINNNRVSGLGLGLYIIQNIMMLHGSRINVESEVNKGSTFYFTLPLTQFQG